MQSRNDVRSLLILVCLAFACGGSSTKFETVWGRPAAVHRVVVLYNSHDGAMRRSVEDAMTRKLMQRGFQAVTSYAVLTTEEMEDLASVKSSLAAKGFDGLVEVRFIDPVLVETNLYSLREDELLWSARSRTNDADSTREVIDEVTTLVASTLDRGVAARTARR
jgi:hypothetical protein